MVSVKDKRRMKDYLVEKMRGIGHFVEPEKREIVSGISSNYLKLDDCNGVVLLVDRVYPGDSFEEISRRMNGEFSNFGAVLFKDGKTFFRNAASRHDFRRQYGLSLKKYDTDEMHRMILFRPEEISLDGRRNWVQYFQPKSERLPEGLVSYVFEPVRFDYSHINPYKSFRPEDRNSTMLRIWGERHFTQKNLKLADGLLKG